MFGARLRFSCVGFVVAVLAATSVYAEVPTPAGVWMHANQRIRIEIVPCGDRLCGKLIWFKRPNDAQGLPLVDVQNSNPALRGRPLLGLTILEGLRRSGEHTWEDGRIYNPDDGEDYRARMTIGGDGTLRVRAYVLAPLFGETQIWTRVAAGQTVPK
ncbi:MAG: DUF2147 domain-containing protein [Alphaproteobacteria bacterium]